MSNLVLLSTSSCRVQGSSQKSVSVYRLGQLRRLRTLMQSGLERNSLLGINSESESRTVKESESLRSPISMHHLEFMKATTRNVALNS